MELIEDIPNNKKIIQNIIKKYGQEPEHHYWYLYNFNSDKVKSLFLRDGNFGTPVVNYGKSVYEIFTEVIAKDDKKFQLLVDSLKFLFKKGAKKIYVMSSTNFRKNLIKKKEFVIGSHYRTFHFPIITLKNWNLELKGKKFKKLRNKVNRFYEGNRVEVVESSDVRKEDLLALYKKWKKGRRATDRLWNPQIYENFIKNDFKGTDLTRVTIVNGIPCIIAAGWKIPNSNNFYSAIGIFSYDYIGMGEADIVYEMAFLKKKGHDEVNLGASEKSLFEFKQKFCPGKFYKNLMFIVRKK